MKSEWLVQTGIISYSIYLWEFAIFALIMINCHLNHMAERLVGAVLAVLVTYFIAHGSYYLFERPVRLSLMSRLKSVSPNN